MKQSKAQLVKEYEDIRPLYEEYTERLGELIRLLLRNSGLSVHLVQQRTKEVNELAEKVTREGKDYNNLREITDLSGIRIICLYSDLVDKVAELIERNFIVDRQHSIDKRQALDPDRFGYISRHYVVTLTDDRVNLEENRRFKGLFAEIQVRSVLQHAWAEIEHSLGYDIPYELPRELRRKFAVIAGLLEFADESFVDLRYKVEQYVESLGKDITTRPQDLVLNRTSLAAYYSYCPIIRELDEYIAETLGARTTEDIPYIDADIQMIHHFNVSTIDQLDELMTRYQSDIKELSRKWIKATIDGEIRRGISVFYLCILLIGMTQDSLVIDKYLEDFPIISWHSRTSEIGNEIKEVTRQIMDVKSKES